MATALAEMPGVACNLTQPMADVAVKVLGPDRATLERVGEEIRVVLAERGYDPVVGARPLFAARPVRVAPLALVRADPFGAGPPGRATAERK